MIDKKAILYFPIVDQSQKEPGGAVEIGAPGRTFELKRLADSGSGHEDERREISRQLDRLEFTSHDQLQMSSLLAVKPPRLSPSSNFHERPSVDDSFIYVESEEGRNRICLHSCGQRLQMTQLHREISLLKQENADLKTQLSEARHQRRLELSTSHLSY